MVFMVSMKTPTGHTGMPLPSEGIYDGNGHLFHHSSGQPMLASGVQRLREHGIIYETNKFFSKEEDAIIKENWEEFRKEHHLDEMDILRYIGFGGIRGKTNCPLTDFRRRTHMWPRLCRGLVTRCSRNVRARILRLYHSRVFPDRPFTPDDDILLQQLYKRALIPVMCETMHRSFGSLNARLQLLQRRQMFSQSERRKLWNIIRQLTPCVADDDGWIWPHPDDEVWVEISKSMLRCKKTLLNEWNSLVTELESLRDQGRLTFVEALDKVAPLSAWISAADFSEFIEIFLDEVPNLETLRLGRLQQKSINGKMRTHGVTGFWTGRQSELTFCRYRLGRMLSALRRNLLRPASLRLSLSTQLRLLSRCLRSLPGAEKNQRFVLRRSHVIKQIEKQMTSERTDWKLSRKLRRYIEGEKD